MSKTVIITGANGNLGTAVTKKFLSAGYQVIATVINSREKDSIPIQPGLQVNAVNLSNEQESYKFIDDVISTNKSIDAILMLAGGFAMGNIDQTSGDDLKKMYSLNFETAYFVARKAFVEMKKQGSGKLIFVGARPALDAADGKTKIAYALSKSLLFKFAELLNASAKGTSVTATVIVPSTIDTPPNRNSMPEADFTKWVRPEQIADLLEMICSETGSPLRETVLKVYGES